MKPWIFLWNSLQRLANFNKVETNFFVFALAKCNDLVICYIQLRKQTLK